MAEDQAAKPKKKAAASETKSKASSKAVKADASEAPASAAKAKPSKSVASKPKTAVAKPKTAMAAAFRVTQTGSPIGRRGDQRATLIGLGLNKMGRSRDLPDTPEVQGMIRKVNHLVRVDAL